MLKKSLLSCLYLLTTALLFCLPGYIIQTGHTGPVNWINYQEFSQSLVSAGRDGTVRVLDLKQLKAIHAQRVASGPLQLCALHPQKPHYAVSSLTEAGYRISVWDWSQNRELYSITLESKPLYINYSPLGNYLVVCVENWKSLNFYNADKGTQLDKFTNGFGIVSYVVFSSKETTIMTYQPSGKIIYWELSLSKKINEFKAEGGIIPVTMTADKRFLVGFAPDTIIFINVVTGEKAGSVSINGLVVTAGGADGNNIACFCRRSSGTDTVRYFTIDGPKLNEVYKTALPNQPPLTAMTVFGNKVFAGNADGEILQVNSAAAVKLAENTLALISDLSFSKNRLAIGTRSTILILKSDFFDAEKAPIQNAFHLSIYSLYNPFAQSLIGMSFQDNYGLYIWNLGERNGVLALIDDASFSQKRQVMTFSSALVKLLITPQAYVSIEQSGLCRVFSCADDSERFHYTASGVNTVALIPPNQVVFGKSRLSTYDSPLTMIEQSTGETTLLSESARIIHDILYNEKNKTLYYLCFEDSHGIPSTVIKSRNGNLKNDVTVYQKPGELLPSSIALDRERGRLYFSFGENQIYCWDGSTVTTMEASSSLVKKIYVFHNNIFSLNANSSITVWNVNTKKIVLSFYLFKDLTWALLTPDGRYFSQGNIDSYLRIYEPGIAENDLRDRYRLNFSVTFQ